MGCDIHFYVEYREFEQEQKVLVSNRGPSIPLPWTSDMQPNKYYDPTQGLDDDDPWNTEFELRRWYGSRNYELFYMLARVRYDIEGVNPIDEPRGLPDDVSPLVKACSDQWNGDGHSHSYFSLQELVDYDWTKLDYATDWLACLEEMKQLAFERCGNDFELVRGTFWFDN